MLTVITMIKMQYERKKIRRGRGVSVERETVSGLPGFVFNNNSIFSINYIILWKEGRCQPYTYRLLATMIPLWFAGTRHGTSPRFTQT